MKIIRTEYEARKIELEDEIIDSTTIPFWITNRECDCCKYQFRSDHTVKALRLKSGNVMIIHAECKRRLMSPDEVSS